MKINVENLDQLTNSAQIDLLERIICAAAAYDKETDFDNLVILTILQTVIEKLDELDEEDAFGTEGWRHSILGED